MSISSVSKKPKLIFKRVMNNDKVFHWIKVKFKNINPGDILAMQDSYGRFQYIQATSRRFTGPDGMKNIGFSQVPPGTLLPMFADGQV